MNTEQTEVRVTVGSTQTRAATETDPIPKIFKEEANKIAGSSVAPHLPAYLQLKSGLLK